MEKSRNNSRRLMAIIAVVLMVCLILAMGAVTFAKYITSGTTGDQTATAAKWGFVVTVDVSKLLGENYKKSDESSFAEVTSDDSGVAVKASATGSKVVAPGTSGSVTFTISGSAEVAAKVSIKLLGDTKEIGIANATDPYNPIKWTYKNGSTTKTADSLNGLVTEIDNLLTIEPGTSLINETYTISWEWALETGDTNDLKATNNVKDTVIGYKADGKAYTAIKDLYVGIKRIGDEINGDVYSTISSQMSFNIAFSIEQAQQ